MEVDVAVSLEMFAYLYDTILRLTDEHFKANPAPKDKARTYRAAYRDGMSVRLSEKLKEVVVEKEIEAAKECKGLMVVKQGAIAEYLGHKAEYGNSKRTTARNDAAFSAGYNKGGSVPLNKQLG